ncbi:hypothetical protein JVU11DRAFT_11242 [Chiua virens]|nr:hypothetical protein JVU11DRAFT_11242 [Chiua virens]
MNQECIEEQVTTGPRMEVPPPVIVLRRQKSERAKLACQNCRRDNKSVTISGLVRGVLRGARSAFMLDGGRSLSSFVVKRVERIIASARTRGLASNASTMGRSAPCQHCTKKGYQCVDRVCTTCVQQGIEGECPHRLGREVDTSDGDGNGQATSAGTSSDVHPAYPPSLPMPPPVGMAPGMVHPLVYGPSPYHMAIAHPSGHGPGEGYPRAPYYPVIDPQIDVPQLNVSSERYDLSSAQSGASSSSS